MLRPRLLSLVLGVACLVAAAPVAATAAPIGADGMTAPAYDYGAAVRERVYIPVYGVDQDGNGEDDVVAAEIMRPSGTGPSFQVPAIIDPSPYYTSICRGNEGQCIADTNSDGVNDKWPLFLDNYFVPRGYAVVLAEAVGTANGTGCVLHGGPGDVQAMKAVVDWLQGRIPGFRDLGHTVPMTADWDNGRAAMIGKSYDGTLTEGVAATGVEGLTTIVPESAISDWYTYSRMGGIRASAAGTHYPRYLSSAVMDLADQAACAPAFASLDAADGDATGDRNPFWEARDYRPGLASNLRASVLAVHGLQDDNVRMDELDGFWAAAKTAGVPHKLWLLRAGHADPFDVRRAAWVDTLHAWFDHWLYDIDNDVMDQPRVDIEAADGTWSTEADWPAPATQDVGVHLGDAAQTSPGELRFTPGEGADTVTWTDASPSETTMMNNPLTVTSVRRVFLSAPLTHDLRISGTPVVQLRAALDKTQSNLGALLVDYGDGTQIRRDGEGIQNVSPAVTDCWGSEIAGDFSACYRQVFQPTQRVTQWRVTRGMLDSANRASLTTPAPVTVGTATDFPISLVPDDYVFPVGHQIGVVLVGNYSGLGASGTGTAGTTFTMDAKATTLTLPVVGGAAAAARSGAFDAVTPTLTLPADQTAQAPSGASEATVSWSAPAVTDDQDPSPAVACDPASGSAFPVGTTVVTCRATDASGNATTGTFTVTVTQAPTPPADDHGGSGGDGGQTVGGTVSDRGPAPAAAQPSSAVPPPATRLPPVLDTVPVAFSGLSLSGRHGQVLATFRLGDAATVTVSVRRHGARRATKTVRKTYKKSKQRLRLRATALKPGRYDVTITVTASGHTTRTLHRTVTVRRAG
jgi:X-Pro dipeptidyl-peptidase